MYEILALASKDLRLLLRDKAGFFFVFFFPIIYAVFFGLLMSGIGGSGGSNPIRINVVDEDQTDESAAFIKTLADASEIQMEQVSRTEAADRVRQGKSVAYVVLTPGFGEARSQLFWGDPPTLEVGLDPARQAEAGMLQGILTKYMMLGFQERLMNPDVIHTQVEDTLTAIDEADDMDPMQRAALQLFLPALDGFMSQINPPQQQTTANADPTDAPNESNNDAWGGFEPLRIEVVDVAPPRKEGPRSGFEITFPQGIVWGIMGCAAGFGISLVVERTRGTLVRLCSAPISQQQILAGKALACLIATLGVCVFLLLLGVVVFGVRPASYPLLGLAILCSSLAFVGIMMLLSVLGRTEQAAGGIGWAILMIMAMLGGGMIPLFVMPSFMQTLSNISPIKWAILAIEGAIWRGFSLVEMLPACGILLAIGVVCYATGVRAFRWAVAD